MIFNWEDFSSLDFEEYQQNLADYMGQGTNIIGAVYTEKIRISIEFESDEDTVASLVLKYFDTNTVEQLYLGETRLDNICCDWTYDAFTQFVEAVIDGDLKSHCQTDSSFAIY